MEGADSVGVKDLKGRRATDPLAVKDTGVCKNGGCGDGLGGKDVKGRRVMEELRTRRAKNLTAARMVSASRARLQRGGVLLRDTFQIKVRTLCSLHSQCSG